MTTQQTPKSRQDTRVGVGAVGAIGVAILTIALVLITLALGAAILEFWPPECPATDEPAATPAATPSASPGPSPEPTASPAPGTGTASLVCAPVSQATRAEFGFWGLSVTLNREQNLLLLVALLGALGSMGHILRSFFRYAGERKLVWSWISMYFMTPLVGAILAVLTYIILRAGLLGTAGGAVVGNTWGFAAIAALVGLFSAQAAAKLKQVMETLFSPAEQGTESLDTVLAVSIKSFSPKAVSIGDKVDIEGNDLETVKSVLFSGGEKSPATFDDARAVLETRVPKGAVTGPLTVSIGKDTATSIEDLTIT